MAEYRFRYGVLIDLVLADLADQLFVRAFRPSHDAAPATLAAQTESLDALARIAACETFLTTYELLSVQQFATAFESNANDTSRHLLLAAGEYDVDDDAIVATCMPADEDEWSAARRAQVLRSFCSA